MVGSTSRTNHLLAAWLACVVTAQQICFRPMGAVREFLLRPLAERDAAVMRFE